MIIDNNIHDHSQLNSDYISILYIPQLLKKKIYKNTLVLVNTYYEIVLIEEKVAKMIKEEITYLSVTEMVLMVALMFVEM